MAVGPIDTVIEQYTSHVLDKTQDYAFTPDPAKPIQFTRFQILNEKGEVSTYIDRLEDTVFELEYIVRRKIDGAAVRIMLDGIDGTLICRSADMDWAPGHYIVREPGIYRSRVVLPGKILNTGAFQLRLIINKIGVVYDRQGPFYFDLSDKGTFFSLGGPRGKARPGLMAPEIVKWETAKVGNGRGDN
ncbi:MAG TPA: hypothetical protein ENL08_01545 [Bacteroidetes bacterium]|nr:hypothetical protein [Bacteroidota bacterium]